MQDNWEKRGGEGRWQEYVNTRTGESSITEHHLKTVWESCPPGECYFEITNVKRRECTCNKCGVIKQFIVGIHKIEHGKIISLV